MSDTVVNIRNHCGSVRIGGGAARRITLSNSTVAKINANRPRTVVQAINTPVQAVDRPTLVKTGGGMGVQGRPGAAGGTIPPIDFAFGDAGSIRWVAPAAGTVTVVRLDFTEAFDAPAQVQVGITADHAALMPADRSDPTQLASFGVIADVEIAQGDGVWLEITPNGATRGAGTLYVSFVPEV
jgi:hypothetical protein